MLTCPNCGVENRFGAIFCRGCGKKLDIIDEITVENIHEKTTGKKRRRKKDKSALTPRELRTKGVIINAIRIAIILLVGFAVYLTQVTPPISAIPTSEAAAKSFVQKKKQLEDAIKNKGTASVTVTQKELNSHIAELVSNVEKGKLVKLENVQVAFGNGAKEDEIAVRMYVRVFGKQTLFQLFGKVDKSKGEMKFSAAPFAKVGKLPYPAFLMKMHSKNVLKNMQSDTDLFKKLSQATIKSAKVRGGGATPAIELKVVGK